MRSRVFTLAAHQVVVLKIVYRMADDSRLRERLATGAQVFVAAVNCANAIVSFPFVAVEGAPATRVQRWRRRRRRRGRRLKRRWRRRWRRRRRGRRQERRGRRWRGRQAGGVFANGSVAIAFFANEHVGFKVAWIVLHSSILVGATKVRIVKQVYRAALKGFKSVRIEGIV